MDWFSYWQLISFLCCDSNRSSLYYNPCSLVRRHNAQFTEIVQLILYILDQSSGERNPIVFRSRPSYLNLARDIWTRNCSFKTRTEVLCQSMPLPMINAYMYFVSAILRRLYIECKVVQIVQLFAICLCARSVFLVHFLDLKLGNILLQLRR